MTSTSFDATGDPALLAAKLKPAVEIAILEMIVAAYFRWKFNGFPRFDDTENSITAVLVGCIRDIKREQNLPFQPRMEQSEFSSDVLAGIASPKKSPRIDISIMWDFPSDEAYYIIECKRLRCGPLTQAYIREGMRRFISGKYGHLHHSGAMMGYVVTDSVTAIVDEINDRLVMAEGFQSTDQLVGDAPIGTLPSVYRSNHSRESGTAVFAITHLLVDTPSKLSK